MGKEEDYKKDYKYSKDELDKICVDIQNVSKSIDFSSLNLLGDLYKELLTPKFKEASILSNFPSISANVTTPSQHISARIDMPIKEFDRVNANECYVIMERDILQRGHELFRDSLREAKVEEFAKLSMDIFDSQKDAGLFYFNRDSEITRDLQTLPLELLGAADFHNTGKLAKTKIGSIIVMNIMPIPYKCKYSYKENIIYFVPFNAVKIVEGDFTVMSCIKNRNGELFVGWEVVKDINLDIDIDRVICFKKTD